jgi:hypothetical protein
LLFGLKCSRAQWSHQQQCPCPPPSHWICFDRLQLVLAISLLNTKTISSSSRRVTDDKWAIFSRWMAFYLLSFLLNIGWVLFCLILALILSYINDAKNATGYCLFFFTKILRKAQTSIEQ